MPVPVAAAVSPVVPAVAAAVPVPVAADQLFWAGRLAALGAATAPMPFASLTEERLAEALSEVVRRQACARAAAVAARHMAAEDGTGAVLKALG